MNSERIEAMYDARDLKRLHALPTIKVHTMAEHVFGASAMAVELCEHNPDANLGEVLKMLLLHDVAEVWTGDVPAHIKKIDPRINDVLCNIEDKWLEEKGIKLPKVSSLTATIAQAADRLDLAATLLLERQMGNHHPTIEIVFKRALEYAIDECQIRGVKEIATYLTEEFQVLR